MEPEFTGTLLYELIEPDELDQYPLAPFLDFAARPTAPELEAADVAP